MFFRIGESAETFERRKMRRFSGGDAYGKRTIHFVPISDDVFAANFGVLDVKAASAISAYRRSS